VKTLILGLFAETGIHCGAGSSGGLIDLPVAREAATDYPVIPGSSFKGALKQSAKTVLSEDVLQQLFGQTDNAGSLLVSDARLLLLPVRALDSAYRWVSCPHLLERAGRDAKRAGIQGAEEAFVDNGQALALGAAPDAMLFLEERQFRITAPPDQKLVSWLQRFLPSSGPYGSAAARLGAQLAIISDDDFVWFARNALTIMARNQLDDRKKSKNLWYEESLPADTVLYTLLGERTDGAAESFEPFLARTPYIQVGGNETVGMGWLATNLMDPKIVLAGNHG
jgi:CRISPR-associated protein Cmr4